MDDQDFRLHVRRHRKREPHVHSGRVTLDRCVDELLNFSEGHNLVELAADLSFAHAEYRTVKKDVFTAGQLRMKPCTNFQQRAHTPVNTCSSARGFCDTRKDSEQRALSCSIATDDSNDVTRVDLERDIVESPDVVIVDS